MCRVAATWLANRGSTWLEMKKLKSNLMEIGPRQLKRFNLDAIQPQVQVDKSQRFICFK